MGRGKTSFTSFASYNYNHNKLYLSVRILREVGESRKELCYDCKVGGGKVASFTLLKGCMPAYTAKPIHTVIGKFTSTSDDLLYVTYIYKHVQAYMPILRPEKACLFYAKQGKMASEQPSKTLPFSA